MVSSFSGKEKEKDALHQKFVLGLQKLQASGFRYFLYGTIYCQNLVLQMAVNYGLFCQRKDGHIELPDGSVMNASLTSTKRLLHQAVKHLG